MEAALFGAFDFVAKNKWARYVAIGVAAFFTLGIYLLMRDAGVRERNNQRWLKKQAEEAAKVANTRRTIQETRTNDVIQADRAADSLPRFDSVDQLREQRPDLYAELFGSPEAGSSAPEGDRLRRSQP